MDYALENKHQNCREVLSSYPAYDCGNNEGQLQQFKLMAYEMTSDLSNCVDHDLLVHLLEHIHTEKPIDGSILVFLPGISDITEQYEMIENTFVMTNYKLFVLHSGVNGTSSSEQSRIFDRMTPGTRKIILSTNIAETSVTISDVVSFETSLVHIFLYIHFCKFLSFIPILI